MPGLASSICIMQIGPPDQLWNALLTNAKIVIEFSLSEGIPSMLLAAVQKGKPIITVKEIGLFSFTGNVDNILFVEKGDADTIALLLFDLWSDPGLADQMALREPRKLRDELTTVGNAVNWLFLASELSREGSFMEPDGENIFQLANRGVDLYV
jgi:glycosyltransferase involved in cell wall biosynthesis